MSAIGILQQLLRPLRLLKDRFSVPNHSEDWPIEVGINSKLKGIFSRPHAER